jgi:Tol biopolymer transport system component
MDADGGNQTRLTFDPAGEMHPDFSPDGTRIAFASNRDGNNEIYVMDADGGNVARLTNDPAEDMRPDWSPDGAKILFNSDRDGNREIYVMNADGGNPTRLTSTLVDELFPVWSPDGTKIAFFDLPMAQAQDIYVMNADGTGVQKLTDHPGTDEDPAWSPDGKRIVFQSTRDGNFELYVMDADGGNVERVTTTVGGDYWPSWTWLWAKLASDSDTISASAGAQVNFLLDAGPSEANRPYALLGSVSGTGPGWQLPTGVMLPLCRDAFTGMLASLYGTPLLPGFIGSLDGQGQAVARIRTGPLSPAYVGLTLHFAYCLRNPPDRVSNPVPIEIVW